LINIRLIFITTMAGSIKNLIIRSLLYWIPMINWPTFKSQSHKTPATIFARTPAFWRQYNPLDVGNKLDLYVYDEGRAPVLKGNNCFDLKPETLGQFLRILDKKATDQGWNNASSTQQIGIFNITHNGDPTTISITKEHHYIEMDALRSQCKQFMIEGGSQH
jgi:hypothetical protein